MGNHRSGMVRRNIVPQPTLSLGFVGGYGVVSFVASGVWNCIAENFVNYMSGSGRTAVHNPPPV
jgi:hypothetical protein